MQYFLTTQIHDENGEEFLHRRGEISADEVIALLRPTIATHQQALNVVGVKRLPVEKKTYKKREKVAGLDPKPAKVSDGKTKQEIRAQIHKLYGQGKKAPEIVEITGIKLANVYYYLKDAPKSGTTEKVKPVAETPTKWGEREIDKEPEMFAELDFGTIKDEFEQGINLDMLCLTYPDFDREEMRRVKRVGDYREYKADYKRQFDK